MMYSIPGMINRLKLKNPNISLILRAVEDVSNVPYNTLNSRHRYRKYVMPRMVAMYIMSIETELTYNEIGAIFGRHHATVIHAMKCVSNKSDHTLRELYININERYMTLRNQQQQNLN